MRFRIGLRVIILAAAGLAACHDSPTGPPAGASLRFSGAVNVSDTIDAAIPQALVVEVHDSTGGLAPAGTVVRFTAVPGPQLFRGPEVYVQALTSPSYSDFATGLVDQAGKTGVLVRLGTVAGAGRIAVSVPTLGLLDTVRLTVKPGNAVRVLVTPADTALYVGKSYTLRGGTADRWSNPRTDPVTWTSSGGGVSVTSAGVVTATTFGRYQIRADGVLGGVPGNGIGWVSVVPTGRFAALAVTGNYQSLNVLSVDVDGSNRTTLATATDGGIGVHPAWIPGTSTVVYTTVDGPYQKLYSVGSDGVAKLFFATTPPNVTHQAEPTPSADGKWLFFSVYDTACVDYDYCIARSKIDGSGYELLATAPSRQPAPSPDGSKVAFMTPNDQQIRVFDVATKAASTWSVGGTVPAWSPDGTRIAYRNYSGGVSIVTPDGAAQSVPGGVFTYGSLAWSPDSKWLILQNNGGPALVDPTTGISLPLGYSSNMTPMSMK
jgi:Tol biopolymer transport system component